MRLLLFLVPVVLLTQPQSALTQTATNTAAPKPKTAPVKRPTTKPVSSMTPPTPLPLALSTDDEKTIYALGLLMYRSVTPFGLSPAELDLLKRALTDAAANKPALDIAQWGPKIQPFAQARAARAAEEQKVASAAYLEKAAAEPGVEKTASGLLYKEERPGSGASPKPTDTVKVQYRGTKVDGTEFDSSYSRNEPAEFALNKVIACWTEGVGKMKVGGKSRLVCPANLAYGEQGNQAIPGGAALIFEVELVSIAGGAPGQ